MTKRTKVFFSALFLLAAACRNDGTKESSEAAVDKPPEVTAAIGAARAKEREPRTLKQSRSTDHLPRSCRFAMRVSWRDAQQSASASKVRRTLEERFGKMFPTADGSPLKYFSKLGIDPEHDIEDIAICTLVGPTPNSLDTLVVLAGNLPDDILRPDVLGKGQPIVDISGVKSVHVGRRGWLAQAPDGALVFGTARTVVEAALFGDAHDYALDKNAALAMHIEGHALRGMLSKMGEAPELKAVKIATVHVERDFDSMTVRAVTESKPNAQKLAAWFETALKTPSLGGTAAETPFTVSVDRSDVWMRGSLSSNFLEKKSL